jgi:flagellar motor protein MotB
MKIVLLTLVPVLLTGCAHQGYSKESMLNAQLEREIAALHIRLEMVSAQKQGSLVHDKSRFHTLCMQIFADSEAEVTRDGLDTHITLPAHLLFASGLRIREEAKSTLDLLAQLLNDTAKSSITIVGHSGASYYENDGMGSLSDWSSAFASAATVLEVLTNEFGLNPARATIATQGSTHPVGSSDTLSGRAQNQRVVIIVKPTQVVP